MDDGVDTLLVSEDICLFIYLFICLFVDLWEAQPCLGDAE